ncbi:MAG: AIR synthase-related protein, partial [Dehalococcoidia bacterium]
VIGMLGLLDDVGRHLTLAGAGEGDEVYLLGVAPDGDPSALAGSEYLKEAHGLVAGRPTIDLELEGRLQVAVRAAAEEGIVSAAHDCSEGGLAVALAEMCIGSGKGIDAAGLSVAGRPWPGRLDAALFGEAQSRIVLAVRLGADGRLAEIAGASDVPLTRLGAVGGDRLRLGPHVDLSLAELRDAYEGGLERALAG